MSKKKKKNKNKLIYPAVIEAKKVYKNEIGFGFISCQIRKSEIDGNFVIQIEDPSFFLGKKELGSLEVEEVLLDEFDCSNKFHSQMHSDILELKGRVSYLGEAFKSSFERLNLMMNPDKESMFVSNHKYYELKGKNSGLYFNEQMILSFDNILLIFEEAAKKFIIDF